MEFILVIPVALFLIYQSLTGLGVIGLPVVSIAVDNNILKVLAMVMYKWGIVLGIFGLFYAIAGILMTRKENNQNTMGFSVFMIIIYYVSAFISIC